MAATSTMVLEELLDARDPRFLERLFAHREPAVEKTGKSPFNRAPIVVLLSGSEGPLPRSSLTAFADKWVAHPSDFARTMLLRYVDDGCARPGHRPLVRRLLALAEDRGDHELLARFVVVFDRLVVLAKRIRYDYASRTRVPRLVVVPARTDGSGPRTFGFSGRTRHYLQRRALRSIRMLGYRQPEAFLSRALEALSRYEDAHLDSPEKLVASYSLLRLLHAHSEVLQHDGRRIGVRVGRQLAELVPAPMHPDAWSKGFDAILAALPLVRALFVRKQLALYLRASHGAALELLDLPRVLPLLRSEHADLAALGAELLASSKSAETLPVKEWLALAEVDDPTALAVIAARMTALVAPARVSVAEAARLACSRHGGIAELGASLLTQKAIAGAAELEEALVVRNAGVASARATVVAWLAPKIADERLGSALHVRDLFDARHADVRAVGLALLTEHARFSDDVSLWAALAESPYDDVRMHLTQHLAARLDVLAPASLAHLWAATLLAVHRGSRAKQGALRTIGERIVARPEERDSLLSLLSLALRSVREAERRSALAALVRAAARSVPLREALADRLPELSLAFDAGIEIPPLPPPRRAVTRAG